MGNTSSKKPSSPQPTGLPFRCNGTDILWRAVPTSVTSRYVTIGNINMTCMTKCNAADQPQVMNGAYTGKMNSTDPGNPVYTPTLYYPCHLPTNQLCPKIDIACKVSTGSAGAGVNLPTLTVR